ncbi:MAG: SCO family protein [Burkholderiales bacterium]|nr:SCO family protein [Burkholderiales bacterium]
MKITFSLPCRHICRLFAATMLIPLSVWAAPTKTPALPANSVYQLPVPFTDQDGRASTLADWRGKPVMITMFYSSCQFVCPRIVEALKKTEASLAPQHAKLPVLMVTLDPARDDTATLKAMAAERHIDPKRWTLARTDARNVRKLAAMLGIQYRELPSGEFNHSSVIILLDAEGRVIGKTSTLGEADPAFVKLVNQLKR